MWVPRFWAAVCPERRMPCAQHEVVKGRRFFAQCLVWGPYLCLG